MSNIVSSSSRVSIILPPSMFINEPSSEHFLAIVLKNRKPPQSHVIFEIIPSEKKMVEVELSNELFEECCRLGFTCIDGSPYNVFHKEGEEEWDIRIPEYHKTPLTFKGKCYITGNMYKNSEEGSSWKVLHIPYTLTDVQEWIYWK